MLGGRKITATCTREMLEGSVAKCCPQRGILLPPLCCPNVDEVTEEMADIHRGMRYPYQRKIPQILSYSFFWRLKSMEQWRYGKTNFFDVSLTAHLINVL
jgi:hypothetical protein